MPYPLHIVDVFAEQALTGNPLAVVVESEPTDDHWKLRVATEMNCSDTVFVQREPEADGAFRIRIFTPTHEIAFGGHPMLGAAWVVRHHLAAAAAGTVRLAAPVGVVTIAFEDGDLLWLRAPPVVPGRRCEAAPMAAALGLAEDDIDDAPIQEFRAGVAAMLVPLRGLSALRRSRLDLAAFAPLARNGFAPLVYAFCNETHSPDNDLCARFFFASRGVREDPATGNAAAFLGRYLLEQRAIDRLALRIEQGHEVGRPSCVRLRARCVAAGCHEIDVGGRVFASARGELL